MRQYPYLPTSDTFAGFGPEIAIPLRDLGFRALAIPLRDLEVKVVSDNDLGCFSQNLSNGPY
jgi:hypothetical protein